MARKASSDTVAADMAPPKYREAVTYLRIEIEKKKTKIASLTSEIGDIMAKVEGCKVHKTAARWFITMDKLEQAERLEIMRSFDGLAQASGWDSEGADLVDNAEGNVVPLRMVPALAADEGDDGEQGNAEADGDNGEEQVAPAPRRGRKPKADSDAADGVKSAAEARKAAMRHLGGEAAPFTGDNSDLRRADDDLDPE